MSIGTEIHPETRERVAELLMQLLSAHADDLDGEDAPSYPASIETIAHQQGTRVVTLGMTNGAAVCIVVHWADEVFT